MFKKLISICILAYLTFNLSSAVEMHYDNVFECHGCDLEYGWPWVYHIQYSGDSFRGAGAQNEVFYRTAFIANAMVSIIISALIVFLISFLFKSIKNRKYAKNSS